MKNPTDIASWIAALTGVVSVVISVHQIWKHRLHWVATYFRSVNQNTVSFAITRFGKEKASLRDQGGDDKDGNKYRFVKVVKSRYRNTKPLANLIYVPECIDQNGGSWHLQPQSSDDQEKLKPDTEDNKPLWLKIYYSTASSNKVKEKWLKALPKD